MPLRAAPIHPPGVPWRVALALGAASLLLFLHGITRATNPVFDETYYVPAARALIARSSPVNIEHPLFAKELIAAGMLLFGDNALGWRFFAAVSGAVAVMAVFAIGWQLFGRVRPATVAALLAMLNFTIFIQARIGMLDGPMAALVLVAIAAMIAAQQSPRRARRWIAIAGVLFGLAIAAKWTAVPYLALAGLAILARRRDRHGMAAVTMLATTSLAAYLVTFLPAFFYAHDPLTPDTLLPFQLRMLAEQLNPLAAHPYQSSWWSWPLDLRPIWYLYEPVNGVQRGILMIGNPAVIWGGLLAIGYAVAVGWRDRQPALLASIALWAGAYLPWIVIPKKIGFFYYYYLPSILLCLVIAATADHLRARWRTADLWAVLIAASLFVYFYPIISAAALPGPQAFQHWMWLPSWP